jgi:hypothetical protein
LSTAFGLALLIALPHTGPDTVRIRAVAAAPAPDRLADTVSWGSPQIVVETGQGRASIWLLTVADSVYLVAAIPDSTPYWGDDLVVSIDTDGDRADTPQHDDFQWYLRRMLDSSVVLRGRAGRWDPPQGNPDWRLGSARSGEGWDVRAAEETGGRRWAAVLRLERGWLDVARGRPGLAVRIYDNQPSGWHAWPRPASGVRPARVEDQPALWGVVIPTAPAARSAAEPRGAT